MLAVDGAPRVLRVEDVVQEKVVARLDLIRSNSKVRLGTPAAPLDSADYFVGGPVPVPLPVQ